MKPAERNAAGREIALMHCTPDDLIGEIVGGEGTIRVLELAAKKLNLASDEAIAFVDGATALQNQKDAFRISGLLTAERFLEYYPPPNSPKVGAAKNIIRAALAATTEQEKHAGLLQALGLLMGKEIEDKPAPNGAAPANPGA